jgi:transcriptional regulator with XRE-family HTH domain
MSTHRLNTAKLAYEVDLARGAGTRFELSFREVARRIGVGSSLFTRLNDGFPPNADALCSLLLWLNPNARLADYILPGDRAAAPRPAPRHRECDTVNAA